MTFQINSIVSTRNLVSSSLSFQFAGNANCLFVANGLSIYHPIATNTAFQSGCIVPIAFNQYGLKVSPQPMNNYLRIQLKKQTAPNTIFIIRLYDLIGRIVLEKTQSGIDFSGGVIIHTGQLPIGNYFVQVLSASTLDVTQVIKQD
ncbi:MAG: Secretion system C-terminal sorting domain [Bacteroidota bacterium]|jgi:hypothetical protein